jgi:hypothetical protein
MEGGRARECREKGESKRGQGEGENGKKGGGVAGGEG